VVCVPASGSTFEVGETTVTCTATDNCGNDASCSFVVTVTPNPVCEITNSGAVCINETGELCASEGDYTYLWSTGATTRCVTVSPGSYSVTITDIKTGCSTVCPATLPSRPCFENCPKTIGFWQTQCDPNNPDAASRYSAANFLSIVQCVDTKAAIFNFSGTAVNKFCAVMNPTKVDNRTQAKRQFAGFLANVCAGELGLTPPNGNQIFVNLNTPISCTGLTSTTLGGLITEVDGILVALDGANLKNVAVKTQYSRIISCLDNINNRRIPDSFCPAGYGSAIISGGGAENFTAEAAEAAEAAAEAAGSGGEEVFAPGIELYRPSPNPFTGTTRIAYAVTGSGAHVEIGIFDLAGRRVRTLVRGVQEPGRYELKWNGESDSGERAHHGVYFIRSNVAGVMKSMSVVYVK
jgi:hypothetical protein